MWQYQHILCKWMWYNGIRVGEAQNPGPGLMQITGLNVQSLNAFIDDGRFHSGGATISVFSETCATGFVEQKASKQALAAGKHVAYGCQVLKRTFKDQRDCNTKGQARGVQSYPNAHFVNVINNGTNPFGKLQGWWTGSP